MQDKFRRQYTDEDPNKFAAIPNGYDEGMVRLQGEPKATALEPDKFNIVYGGTFSSHTWPQNFLKALTALVNEKPSLEEKIRVFFIGNSATPKVLSLVEQTALKRMVRLIPYLPHDELILYLHGADVLLLLIGPTPRADFLHTGKIFEYIAIGKPILAIVPPEGAAAQLIRKTRTGFVANSSNIEEVKEMIKALYEKWKVNKLAVKPNRTEVMSYSAEKLTAKLADVFNDCLIQSQSKR
jgi:glycosyltransferase involved in cell wall biosynthesis